MASSYSGAWMSALYLVQLSLFCTLEFFAFLAFPGYLSVLSLLKAQFGAYSWSPSILG